MRLIDEIKRRFMWEFQTTELPSLTFNWPEPQTMPDLNGVPASQRLEQKNDKPAATKHDNGKARYSLVPVHAELEVAYVFTDGAIKYDVGNWKENGGFDFDRPASAAIRHIKDFLAGKRWDDDPKSGHRHILANAICELMFLLDFDLTGNGNDNRRKMQYIKDEDFDPPQNPYYNVQVTHASNT